MRVPYLPSVLLALALGKTAASIPTTSSQSTPDVFVLPGNNTFPEGVIRQPNSPYFWTASSTDGTIYRGDLRSPTMTPFLSGDETGISVGLGVQIFGDNLVVAGGPTGKVVIVSVSQRKLLYRFSTGLPFNASFVNEIALDETTGDMWISDTFYPQVWKISAQSYLGRHGGPLERPLERFLDLNDTVPYQPGGLNGNGIVLTQDRKYLIFADFNDQELYRISVKDKSVVRIDVGPGHLLGGVDGVRYRAPYLYSIFGRNPEGSFLYVTELKAPYLKGMVKGRFTDRRMVGSATFDFVSASNEKEVLICNFQYFAENPQLPFTVVRVPVPPLADLEKV